MVAVRRAHGLEALATVAAAHEVDVRAIDQVLILRIHEHPAVIPSALADVVVVALQRPAVATVGAHEEAAVGVLHDGVDLVGVGGGDGHANDAPDAAGQPFLAGQRRPRLSTVGALPEAAAFTATLEAVRGADQAPGAGIEDGGVARLHDQVAGAGLFVDEQRTLPGLSAVGRLVDTTFGVGTEKMAHDGHPYDVGVAGMDDDADDMPSVAQAEVTPSPAGVIGTPHAAEAFGDVAAHRVLALTHVQDLLVGRRHGHGTHRAAKVLVGDILPVAATVGRLPDAAAGGTEIEGRAIAEAARDRATAAAAPGPDKPVADFGKQEGV